MKLRSQELRSKRLLYPNDKSKNMLYVKNVIKTENVHVGDFTYYSLAPYEQPWDFEKEHILYNSPKGGYELIIGKFCSIATGVEIVMASANHSIETFSTYPFNMIGKGWAAKNAVTAADMKRESTNIGNDVWIGRKVRIMPGVTIGDGAIIGAYSVVTKDVPPYTIAGGDPLKIIRKRFDDETIEKLLQIKWWDFCDEKLEQAIPLITSLEHKTSLKKLEVLAGQG